MSDYAEELLHYVNVYEESVRESRDPVGIPLPVAESQKGGFSRTLTYQVGCTSRRETFRNHRDRENESQIERELGKQCGTKCSKAPVCDSKFFVGRRRDREGE